MKIYGLLTPNAVKVISKKLLLMASDDGDNIYIWQSDQSYTTAIKKYVREQNGNRYFLKDESKPDTKSNRAYLREFIYI